MCTSILTKAYGLGRAGLGLAALLIPGPVGGFFGLGEDEKSRMAIRYAGGRDLFLGVGIVLGEKYGHSRGWLEAAIAVDATDGLITADGVRRGVLSWSQGWTLFPVILCSLATGAFLVRQVSNGQKDDTARIALRRIKKNSTI